MILGTSLQAFERSALSQDLLASYLATRHQLVEPAALTVVVGQRHHGLVGLMKAHRLPSAAFLTAWNPASRPRRRVRNDAAQAQLVAALDRHGLPHFASWGHDAGNADDADPWPPEAGCVALGLGLAEAVRLGRRFGQNAIAWAGLDGLPLLVALR